MNHKFWVSAVTLAAAAVVLVSMAMGTVPGTVSAASYSEAEEEPDERSEALVLDVKDTPYGPYEMLTEEQRTNYIKMQQFHQQWAQNRSRLAHEGAITEEPLRNVNPENSRLAVSPEELQRIEDSKWHCPLIRDTFVTSPFGMRLHPVYGTYRMHNGVDLNCYWGDEIVAARTGTVIITGYNDSAGYYVKIDHGDGLVSEYLHLSAILVDEGQEVKGGELIAKAGNTGVSTGVHLHFGIMLDEEYVDPEDYIEF